jgi:isopenicillin N synthase-like dioxygenase
MDAGLPTIDIGAWFDGTDADRRRIALEFDESCRATGFLQLVGHRVPTPLFREVKAVADEFFGLDLDEKRRCEPASREINRGYSASRTESLSYSLGTTRPPDLAEAFIVGAERYVPGDPYYEAERGRSFAPNIWPERPAEFRDVASRYFAEVSALSRTLLDIAALALGVDREVFASATDRSVETLRYNWYVRLTDEVGLESDQMGLGAHTDYGIITVLLADPVPGLQVIGPDGQWRDVLPLEDGFVVNVGDALAVWTNDLWTSTIHRVVPGMPGAAQRRSFAFFQDGNLDAVIECLPSCRSEERPARYAPVTLGRHLQDKLRGGRSLSQLQEAIQTTGERGGELL